MTIAIISVTGASGRASSQEPDDIIESFSVDGDAGPLVLPVKVNGKEYPFIVDTGSTVSVFATSLEASLTPLRQRQSFNAGPMTSLYACAVATVGRSQLKAGERVICRDIDFFGEEFGGRKFGILGMDFLIDKCVQIDFDNHRLLFLKDGLRIDGKNIPLEIGGDLVPMVDMTLPEIGNSKFLIDSGCAGFESGVLSQQTFAALLEKRRIELLEHDGDHLEVGGARRCRRGILDGLSLQRFRHSRQIFSEDSSDQGCNCLGLGYLARYRVTLDFPGRRLLLEKGKRFENALPVNAAGIDFSLRHRAMTISKVERGSRAFDAGLRPGDTIILINGIDARQLAPADVGPALNLLEERVYLTVKRPSEYWPRVMRLKGD